MGQGVIVPLVYYLRFNFYKLMMGLGFGIVKTFYYINLTLLCLKGENEKKKRKNEHHIRLFFL